MQLSGILHKNKTLEFQSFLEVPHNIFWQGTSMVLMVTTSISVYSKQNALNFESVNLNVEIE